MSTTIGCPIPGASQPKQQPKTIVERVGEPAFLEQLAEECSELAQAALKEHVRLIDANALKKRVIKVMFRDCPESGEFYAVGTDDIDIMPTIDPESLRPTAHC